MSRVDFSAHRQRGVALMIVIFIFALVSILSVGIYNRQSLFVQLAGNMVAQSQAYEYAVASEIYGRRLLKFDWDDDKDTNKLFDDLEDIKGSIVIPVEEAFLEAQFNDVQGKLNINDLVLVASNSTSGDNSAGGQPNPVMFDRFKRLFSSLSIDDAKVESLLDWIDSNQDPTDFAGAEDGEYLGLDQPYRTAGQPMTHVSELLLIQGMTQEDYEKLLPHVCALPQGQAPINLNTATNEVLMSLSNTLNKGLVERLIEARTKEPWTDINAFKNDPAMQGVQFDEKYLGVRSSFYEIATVITLGDHVERLVSLVYRNERDGKMQTLSRDQSQKYLITKQQVTIPST